MYKILTKEGHISVYEEDSRVHRIQFDLEHGESATTME